MPEVKPEQAAELIVKGKAPAGLTTGVLQLSKDKVGKIDQLPSGLRCYSLTLAGQPLAHLPPDLQVEYKLDLTDCSNLVELPPQLSVSTLILTNCHRLTGLPAGLQVHFLQLDGCTALEQWPETAQVSFGWVRARGCVRLESLPKQLGPLASLDLRGCRLLQRIPDGVSVQSWIDVGGAQINSLPETLAGIALRWRGVPVSTRVAFFPETLTGAEILAERNAELRRVMIERVGFDKFLQEVKAQVLDTDRDRGGERKLLRVPLENDEPIVVVSVQCPSTGRQYLIRVPPDTRSCRAAIAWTAGFDKPDDYAPIEET